ncbi:MAG: metallophosphoesterase [Clostridia bacterium]|nr:metallophosphoesterase [Clostridia bacterium]
MVVLIIFLIRLYIDNNVLTTTYISFTDTELPENFSGTKILQISDLHNKSYGKNNEVLIKEIEKINPEYIFLTGDMVSNKDVDFTPFFNLVSILGNKYKCFYIIGNHEMDLTNRERNNICDTLKSYNVKVLDNEMVELVKNDEQINLYGMWYNPKFYIEEEFYLENMEKIMGNSKTGFNILLTHNPDDFEIYADWGADLIFSGHVHGGMVRLPIVGGVISPNRFLFPKYDAGLYKYNNSSLIVSRGLSRGTTGLRVFNQPELVVVTLQK